MRIFAPCSRLNGAPKIRKFGEIAKESIKFNIINK